MALNLNIYSVPQWATNTNYNVNDITYYQGYYYYCTVAHNSSLAFSTNFWMGVIAWSGGNKPYFGWIPSYASEVPIKPRLRTVNFGDGYRQQSPDGINNILLTQTLKFDGRNLAETTAILQFLTSMAGYTSFVFTALPPYNTNKLFYCEEWSSTPVFNDNFSITAAFTETPV